MEINQDLDITKRDDLDMSSQQLAAMRKSEVNIGDLEEMELTSKSYKIKTKKTKKFCDLALMRIFLVIFFLYLSALDIYPIISRI